jgi:hypothetical protein
VISVKERSQPDVIKSKMGQKKLKSVVNWQRTRKERGVKEKGVIPGLHVTNLEGLQSNRSSNLKYYFP